VWRDARPLERWRATAREAAKQSRRAWVPAVSPPAPVAELAARPGVLLVLGAGAEARLSTVDLPGGADITLVVGPEGGVAPDELAALEAGGAVPVRLG